MNVTLLIVPRNLRGLEETNSSPTGGLFALSQITVKLLGMISQNPK